MRKPLLIAFLIAVAVYAALFLGIEQRRVRNGPWQARFESASTNAAPRLCIDQPRLGITNVQLVFAGEVVSTNGSRTLRFAEARAVPFAVPFGECVFQDTTTLPGTVVLKLFGHELQLLPRVLTIDRVERPWLSGEKIDLARTNPPSPASLH